MVQFLASRESSPLRILVMILILLALIWATPAEATLGGLVKVVYIHGALVRVAELIFLAGGALGLFYLLRKSDPALRWSWALQKAAFVYWLASFLASLYVMRIAWGGVNWAEPRFLSTGRILGVAAIAFAICLAWERPKVVAASGIFLGAMVAVEIASAGLMLHPANPIVDSPSLVAKAYYYGVVVAVLALAVEVGRLLLPAKVGQGAEAT